MRPSPRLVALPASLLLTAAIVGSAAAPSEGSRTQPAAQRQARTQVAAASADLCGGTAARAVAAARTRGMSYDFLAGASLTRKAASVGDRAVVLGPGRVSLADFAAGPERIDSARVPALAAGLVGAGSDATTVTLDPRSSTRGSAVPRTEYRVNPLNLLRVSSAHAVVGGFSLIGTPQGHTYNGLRIERAAAPLVSDVHVTAIPGDMDRPPGETFGINDYRTVGARYEHVEVDGAGVGAAGFAANGSRDVTVCASAAHDDPVSMGFAFWSVRDVTLVDCTATDNGFAGFNFERVSGRVTLRNPVASGNRWDMRVVSDTGSAVYRIVDPDLSRTQEPGKWTVEVPSTYWKHPGKQRLQDIHLIVDGKERPDLLRIVVPY